MSSRETVLITGCSDGGIDSELALVFQECGFHVFATARNPSKMSKLRGLPNVTLLTLDVVKSTDIKAAVEVVSRETGWNLFEINLIAPISLTQAFAPLLIKAEGMAVYITSISGYLNIPYMRTYSASKRSLEIVAETLRLELAPFGVDVLEIVTGAVKTLGQTYFGDFQLPAESLYKGIEDTIAGRA
ncbi:NADPH-dependent 1-acyldihydroxyacetone phosphate reductase [Daldinia childiae]|uniref:NADPH-dependent 1-acyldihydroxyacetone phosphate reductase n=1 Tax=Daldinia childiae TaxID=326645 RepID=UPI001446A203|nr:NADPH-dependent 1-acyldihydroxyacetone phosphate reductase [Daldinia childiae]KAF3070403.1 NADPH-dependent 1-acyldihydroxyacetone phosphate reductase [Daldinia childiae]